MKKVINIMTSSDDNIAIYILPQLVSINKCLSDYDVNFYLMHSKISDDHMQMIKEFSATMENIVFHEIHVEDNSLFENIVKHGDARSKKGGKIWPHETYYWYFAHYYLPEDIDRIMYIDTGDVVFIGDIGEYYFSDFRDKMIIATARLLITRDGKSGVIQKSDLEEEKILSTLLGSGSFCAGNIVLNLPKFREVITDDYYDNYIESLKIKFPGTDCLYLGDQGLASGVFAGEIAYFNESDDMDVWYKPYNFPVGNFYEREKDVFLFEKYAVHYNAGLTFKPWVARFDAGEVAEHDLRVNGAVGFAPFMITPTMVEFNEIWWDYCKETPIYNEVNYRAEITADALQKNFLPLCKSYNDVVVENKKLEQKNLDLEKCINSVLDEFPLLSSITTDNIPFFKTIIIEIMRDDLKSALDEIYRLAEQEIPDEHAENYLNLAQHTCAAADYADGWIFFKKELVRFFINTGKYKEADEHIKELEDLLADDKEIEEFRKNCRFD